MSHRGRLKVLGLEGFFGWLVCFDKLIEFKMYLGSQNHMSDFYQNIQKELFKTYFFETSLGSFPLLQVCYSHQATIFNGISSACQFIDKTIYLQKVMGESSNNFKE